jgi:ADP-ribose pyrophosphatase YjhB (NUDIX family)
MNKERRNVHIYADDVKLDTGRAGAENHAGTLRWNAAMDETRLLELARRLHGVGRTGLHFCADEYDRERYEEIEHIAAELLAAGAGIIAESLRGDWAAETGYVTPKIEVRGAVFRATDERVLLVRETTDGLWTLPGGWADVNDSPSGAIRREIEQEAGLRVRVVKLAALYDRNAHGHPPSIFHSWKAFFLCEVEGGFTRGSYETDAVDYFALDRLPPMSIGRCTERQVHRMHRHWTQRTLPTDFD